MVLDEVFSVLDRLINERLITSREDTVEVTHEALIREWPRLREWLDSDRDVLKLHRKLTFAAQEWAEHNKDASFLYKGAQLEIVEESLAETTYPLSELEQSFLPYVQ
jgi:hypothetical protein